MPGLASVRALLASRAGRVGAYTYGGTALLLVANLLTGIVIARALGPSGRGTTAAAMTVSQIAGTIVSLGSYGSVSFELARGREESARILSSWAVVLVPAAAVIIAAGWVLMPALFAAQSSHSVQIGRVYLFSVYWVLATQISMSMLLGRRDYLAANVVRVAQPALTAVVYIVLWKAGHLDVTTALIVPVALNTLVSAYAFGRSIRAVGFARPDLALTRRLLRWGIRSHGEAITTNFNARLDVLIIPAFVAAAAVGQYSVAANVSLIVVQLGGALALAVLPAVAANPALAARRTVVAVQVSGLIGLVIGSALFIGADFAVRLVYGGQFDHAAFLLRILLPGTILYGCSATYTAALTGMNRPLTATVTQVIGAVVGLGGLLALVPSGGTTMAAIASTAGYTATLLANVVAFHRVTGTPWRSYLRLPRGLRAGAPAPAERVTAPR